MAAANGRACEHVQSRFVNYIVGKLTSEEREQFDAHLAGCAECRAYFERMTSAAYLSCQELVELVTDYLENRLPPAERQRFEDHLTICPGCDAYLEQMRTTIRVAGKLTEDELEPQTKQVLLDVFRTWKAR